MNLGTTFHLNHKILLIWTKFAQKEYSWTIKENLNIVIEFSIFELV